MMFTSACELFYESHSVLECSDGLISKLGPVRPKDGVAM